MIIEVVPDVIQVVEITPEGGGGIPEAPNDGKTYGRKSRDWSEVKGEVAEAPNDGKTYGRKNLNWSEVTPGGVAEAPNDGKAYARKNLGWSEATNTGNGQLPEYITRVWTYEIASKEACYSSPVGPVLLGASNNVPCVVFCASDWGTYALKIADGTVLWRLENAAECYGRCQWATIGGNNFVFSPCHAGGVAKIDRLGAKVASYPSIYEDATRNAGNITAVATVAAPVYEITSNQSKWTAGPNMFLRPDPAEAAVVEVYAGATLRATGRVVGVTANNKMRIDVPVAPVSGNTYKILPKWSSDVIFMHAGTVNLEGGTNYIYLTGFDNCVRKINASTMAEVWIRASLENIEPYPLLMDVAGVRKVFAVSVDGFLYRLDAGTGTVDWSVNCSPETGYGLDSYINACDLHGDGKVKLCIASRDGRVYAVDAITGVLETRSTNTQSWEFNEINSSAIPVKVAGQPGFSIVTGGDAGTTWRFDDQLNTVWSNFEVPNSINSSSVIHDVRGDTQPCQLVGDMRGTIHVTRVADGQKIGSLYFKGGVEGIPCYGDIDGDGKAEMVVTTTDGFVVMLRFLQGAIADYTGIYPGLSRFTGSTTKT